jgi:HPt (histidine-containing phosphotransfer) domain-containing protein
MKGGYEHYFLRKSKGAKMDLKALAEKVDLDEAEYQEMIDLFLKTTQQHLIQLETAIEAENMVKVIESAHSIKGSAASLGLVEISGIARGMEANARANNLQGADRAVQTIRAEMDRITALSSASAMTVNR